VRKLAFVPLLAVLVALALATLGFAASGKEGTYKLSATLNARQEVPKQTFKVPAARGTFTGTLKGRKLTWRLTFSHLSAKPFAAHIHLGKPGVSGPIIVALCGPCTSGQRGSATVSSKIRNEIERNLTYVNVHTPKNKGGEIRGKLVARKS
jgi:hypothetical protein